MKMPKTLKRAHIIHTNIVVDDHSLNERRFCDKKYSSVIIPKAIIVKKQMETAKNPMRFVVITMSMSSALFMSESLA